MSAPGQQSEPEAPAVLDTSDTADALFDDDEGTWQVTTAASLYVLDLDRRTALRVPGAGPLAEGRLFNVSTLENDNEILQLDQLKFCRLGYPMLLFTDPRPDGTVYHRLSTAVIEIRRLAETEDRPGRRAFGQGGGAP